MQYYIGYEVEVEIEVNDKNERNNGYWYGYGFEDVIEHATILFILEKLFLQYPHLVLSSVQEMHLLV